MSYALTSTKRKFHRLLDSLTSPSLASPSLLPPSNNSSNTSLDLPETVDRATKRARIASIVSKGEALRAQLTRGGKPQQQVRTEEERIKERKKPDYMPWSRESFLERLATFSTSITLWKAKDDRISELVWAKRGWRCVGVETVGCQGCGARVVIDLKSTPRRDIEEMMDGEKTDEEVLDALSAEEDWKAEAKEVLVKKYEDQIVKGHMFNCPWRRKGCDDTIQRVVFTNRTAVLDDLMKRFEEVFKQNEYLPALDAITLPDELDLGKAFAIFQAFLKSRTLNSTGDADVPRETQQLAFLFALTGFSSPLPTVDVLMPPPTQPGIIQCHTCFRRLGLWLYRSQEEKPAVIDTLDPMMEHRAYCPWTNGSTQSLRPLNGAPTPAKNDTTTSEPDQPAWRLLLAILTDVARDLTPEEGDEGDASTPRTTTSLQETDFGTVDAKSLLAERSAKDEKDKERWAKLKKLKDAFTVGNKRASVQKSKA